MTLKEISQATKHLKVLFIEDDEIVRQSTYKVLKNLFTEIDIACDGMEGLEKFNSNKYDLIITDLEMPKLDGVEMLKIIKKAQPDVYIIILSAMNNSHYLIDTIKIGIDRYLFKPLALNQLLESLEGIIQKENVKDKLLNYNTNLELAIKKRTQELENQMNIDDLTSLSTLSALMSKLDKIDNFKSPVVLLINIDSFRILNQLYGFQIGNEILIEFANLLKQYNQNKDYELFRINADEFVLLDTVEYLDIDKYEKDLNELFLLVEQSEFKIDTIEETVEFDITVGISFSSTKPLKKANMALYEARKRGRNFIG